MMHLSLGVVDADRNWTDIKQRRFEPKLYGFLMVHLVGNQPTYRDI